MIVGFHIDILRAFVEVVNMRGFTRAAENLGRTQPTISLQVKRLEELVGSPLFENNSRLSLTSVGRICLDYGMRLLALHDEMRQNISLSQQAAPVIRLGVPDEIAPFIMPCIAASTAQLGNVHTVSVISDQSPKLRDEFELRRLEIALCLSDAPGDDGAVSEWHVPLIWACAPNYIFPSEKPLPLVVPPEGSPYRHFGLSAPQNAEREYEIVLECSSFNGLRAAVRSGMGVSPMHPWIVDDGLEVIRDDTIPEMPQARLKLFVTSEALPVGAELLVDKLRDCFHLFCGKPRARRNKIVNSGAAA